MLYSVEYLKQRSNLRVRKKNIIETNKWNIEKLETNICVSMHVIKAC